jgi:tRNA U34 5-methylaminomethyl-2-thiouridine-forming methyltransferase MnmC
MDHPLFEIVTTTAGAVSIRNKALNEIMHNPVGPWREANALYIDQSKLAARLREKSAEELVLFDVGLGAAANALASLHCAAGLKDGRSLRLISFERELELLKFALKHSAKFSHFAGYEGAIRDLLERGHWQNENVKWELRAGDFRETLLRESHKPHLIFYDPYSSKVNREMWSIEAFRALRLKSREANEGGTLLFTYSQATPIRVALLAAGFYVGHGISSGPKEETTQAATHLPDLEFPLAKKWFERWSRSRAQVPFECPPENEDALRALVRGHQQFAAL